MGWLNDFAKVTHISPGSKAIATKIGLIKKPGDAAPAPAVPSIYDSYVQGVNADLATLNQRRSADAAAQIGGGLVNGRYYSPADYDKWYNDTNQKILDAQAAGDTTAYNAAQAEIQSGQNFAGTGDAEVAQQQLQQEIQGADTTSQGLLDLQQKYGEQFANQSRNELQAADPTGFNLRESYGNALQNGGNSLEDLARTGPNAPTYESFSDSSLPQYQSLSASDNPQLNQLDPSQNPQLARLNSTARLRQLSPNSLPNLAGVNSVTLGDTGQTAAGRAMLEQQTFDELAKAGQPDQALQRTAEQAARARGASSGNILGDASALQESLAVQNAQRGLDTSRRAEALGLLNSGQSVSDKSNTLKQQQLSSDLQSQGFNNAANQQRFGNSLTLNNSNNDVAQQRFANNQTQAGFNNNAAQQEYQNRSSTTGFNNDAAQQGLANKASIAGFNNSVGDSAFNNAMAVVNQRNQTAQNTFAGQQQQTQTLMGARQQDHSNVQSFLGLQPLVAQAGQLQGLQSQAAPFNAGNVQQGAVSDPNAGMTGGEWAAQLYGNQQQAAAGQAQVGAANKSAAVGAGASIAAAAIIAI